MPEEITKIPGVREAPSSSSESFAQALMATVQQAMSQDIPVEKLEKVIELQERREQWEAKQAFHAAMRAFKAEPPRVTKNHRVDFTSKQGRTQYDHATLDEAVAKISPALAAQGLYFRWGFRHLDGGLIEVTCYLSHVLGHTEQCSMIGQPDNTGNKNALQSLGSANSYLQRYTLLTITGLAAEDDDGAMGSGPKASQNPNASISGAKVAELNQLLEDTSTDLQGFIDYLVKQGCTDLTRIDELDEDWFSFAKNMLLKKKQRKSTEGEE